MDLGTDPPADTQITAVQVNLLGVELRNAEGTTSSLDFRAGEIVDLLALRAGDPMRLFTNEQLSPGTYTGIRLHFDADQDASSVTTGGEEFPLLLADGAFAAVDFTVEDGEESSETLTLALDLRQSLVFDDLDEQYTLTPQLRAVRTDDAAQIEGNVAVVCPEGTALAAGGAVYLYSGADVSPDDLGGAGVEPVVTTGVVLDSTTSLFRYTARFLSAGDYTLALTCRGDEDFPAADDELEFLNVQDVQVDEGELLQLNLTPTAP